MCLKWFRPKVKFDGIPSMEKIVVIEELEDDILIHELWAVKVVEEPELAEAMGDYDWHMKWIEVYHNAIYYIEGGK